MTDTRENKNNRLSIKGHVTAKDVDKTTGEVTEVLDKDNTYVNNAIDVILNSISSTEFIEYIVLGDDVGPTGTKQNPDSPDPTLTFNDLNEIYRSSDLHSVNLQTANEVALEFVIDGVDYKLTAGLNKTYTSAAMVDSNDTVIAYQRFSEQQLNPNIDRYITWTLNLSLV